MSSIVQQPNSSRRANNDNSSDNNGSTISEEGEEGDTLAPLCTCGQYPYSDDQTQSKPSKMSGSATSSSKNSSKTNNKTPAWLESSFVHLMTPRRRPNTTSPSQKHQQGGNYQHQPQHGFLEQHRHMLELLEAASTGNVALCMDCTDRVAAALEADTQRLYGETQAYHEAVAEAKHRAKSLESMSKIDLDATERTYLNEIAMLEQEIAAREAELTHLNSLYREQTDISHQLEVYEDEVQQEQNALELQAKAFDDSLQLLSKTLAQVQKEVDQLSMVKLPLSLFDLQVDERGLRYPLINQLRLAFRPKGDVPVKEIMIAWSQATQILLILGTLLAFSSPDWKLVPLADCAKLIYRKEIYNLKPGDCRSLMAWNALLDQVVKHAYSRTSSIHCKQPNKKTPPFQSSPSSIGNTDLTRLDRMDDVAWSQVIHRMASNLLWLSERTSDLVSMQVASVTHSIV